MKKKDECSDVCKECVEQSEHEFNEAKWDLQYEMEWFWFDAKHLEFAMSDGEDVGEKLERFKKACKEMEKIAHEFVFPEGVSCDCVECLKKDTTN